jgi:HAD superfamily hydrolase (TIGR01509 family)
MFADSDVLLSGPEQAVAHPQLIIFDCDGVLVDSEPLAALAYERVYEKHGMSGITGEVIGQCVGMKQADIIVRIKELTGHQFPAHADGDIWAETKRLFSEQLAPTRGLVAFLQHLSARRCVASSSSLERIHHSLDVTGLAPYFGDAIFSSSMVKRGKPAPDIFLHAASLMGAEPKDCVVIEDSPFGVEGAVAAGMKAIGYIGGGHIFPGHAEKLLARGAIAACADWTEIGAQLAELGFKV